MNYLVKILIISDDFEKWISFFKDCHVRNTKEVTTIYSNWFFIRLRSRISDCIRGEKFDKVIVDKLIPDEILHTIVAPMAIIPKITFTKDEYRFGKEEN